jgi:T-complex protein 1 subunit theta
MQFGEAFEAIPRVLATNSGQDATNVVAKLYEAHADGLHPNVGVDIAGEGGAARLTAREDRRPPANPSGLLTRPRVRRRVACARSLYLTWLFFAPGGVKDLAADGVFDLLVTKESALRLAVDAALTVLRVDQIIMSKPAKGGGGVIG